MIRDKCCGEVSGNGYAFSVNGTALHFHIGPSVKMTVRNIYSAVPKRTETQNFITTKHGGLCLRGH